MASHWLGGRHWGLAIGPHRFFALEPLVFLLPMVCSFPHSTVPSYVLCGYAFAMNYITILLDSCPCGRSERDETTWRRRVNLLVSKVTPDMPILFSSSLFFLYHLFRLHLPTLSLIRRIRLSFLFLFPTRPHLVRWNRGGHLGVSHWPPSVLRPRALGFSITNGLLFSPQHCSIVCTLWLCLCYELYYYTTWLMSLWTQWTRWKFLYVGIFAQKKVHAISLDSGCAVKY